MFGSVAVLVGLGRVCGYTLDCWVFALCGCQCSSACWGGGGGGGGGMVVVVAVVVIGVAVVAIIVVIGADGASILYARLLLLAWMPCTCILLVCIAILPHTKHAQLLLIVIIVVLGPGGASSLYALPLLLACMPCN